MARIAAHASVFHAIADPTRRAVLDLLREGDQTVLAMLDRLRRTLRSLTQPGLSQHLSVLRSAGLVTARRLGRLRVYSIQPDPLSEVADWVAEYDKFWTARLDNLKSYLDRHGARPSGAASLPARPRDHSPGDHP
ncbi:MAG: ArsR/SmtB family transcription factor [Phycisphaerales bacterium]